MIQPIVFVLRSPPPPLPPSDLKLCFLRTKFPHINKLRYCQGIFTYVVTRTYGRHGIMEGLYDIRPWSIIEKGNTTLRELDCLDCWVVSSSDG
jgi:hypothetical protein